MTKRHVLTGEGPRTHDAGPTPRQCGGCSVCCTAMRVAPLNKPAGQRCTHQTPHGCGNYQHRPEVCRTWYCMWVRDRNGLFTDDHRPDKLGLFFTASPPDPATGRQTIHAHETRPHAADQPEPRRLIQFLRRFAPIQILPHRR